VEHRSTGTRPVVATIDKVVPAGIQSSLPPGQARRGAVFGITQPLRSQTQRRLVHSPLRRFTLRTGCNPLKKKRHPPYAPSKKELRGTGLPPHSTAAPGRRSPPSPKAGPESTAADGMPATFPEGIHPAPGLANPGYRDAPGRRGRRSQTPSAGRRKTYIFWKRRSSGFDLLRSSGLRRTGQTRTTFPRPTVAARYDHPVLFDWPTSRPVTMDTSVIYFLSSRYFTCCAENKLELMYDYHISQLFGEG